jgi:hypothetical protein
MPREIWRVTVCNGVQAASTEYLQGNEILSQTDLKAFVGSSAGTCQCSPPLALSPVVIVCAQATCMHLMINWSDYMSYCYKKCDGYRLSLVHVSLLFDRLPMM